MASATENGVVTIDDGRAVALHPAVLRRRAKAGILVRVRRGGYRFAAAAPGFSRDATVEIVAARGQALCLWSANHALGIEQSRPRKFHVAVGPNGSRRVTASRVPHRLRRPLLEDELVSVEGVAVTRAARTLRDFAATLSAKDWASPYVHRWTEEALMLHLMTLDDLETQYDRERAIPVRRRLRRLIDHHRGRGTEDLKSKGEAWLRDFLEARGFPLPSFNVRVPGTHHTSDAFWALAPLALEFDSFRYHSTRSKRARDARRQRRVQAEGIPIWPVTADDLSSPTLLAELENDLAAVLSKLPRTEAVVPG